MADGSGETAAGSEQDDAASLESEGIEGVIDEAVSSRDIEVSSSVVSSPAGSGEELLVVDASAAGGQPEVGRLPSDGMGYIREAVSFEISSIVEAVVSSPTFSRAADSAVFPESDGEEKDAGDAGKLSMEELGSIRKEVDAQVWGMVQNVASSPVFSREGGDRPFSPLAGMDDVGGGGDSATAGTARRIVSYQESSGYDPLTSAAANTREPEEEEEEDSQAMSRGARPIRAEGSEGWGVEPGGGDAFGRDASSGSTGSVARMIETDLMTSMVEEVCTPPAPVVPEV